MTVELTAAGAAGAVTRPRDASAVTVASAVFDRFLRLSGNLEAPRAFGVLRGPDSMKGDEGDASETPEAVPAVVVEGRVEPDPPIPDMLTDAAPIPVVAHGELDAAPEMTPAAPEAGMTPSASPDVGGVDRGQVGQAGAVAMPVASGLAFSADVEVSDAGPAVPAVPQEFAKKNTLNSKSQSTSARGAGRDAMAVFLEEPGQTSSSTPHGGMVSIGAVPVPAASSPPAAPISTPGVTSPRSLPEAATLAGSRQPPLFEAGASTLTEIGHGGAGEDRQPALASWLTDEGGHESAGAGVADQASRPIPQPDGLPEPEVPVHRRAAPSVDRPLAGLTEMGPLSGGPSQVDPGEVGAGASAADGRRSEEPLRPRSPLVQNVLDRVATLPSAPGETVIRLKPHGMGLIEVSVQHSQDGGMDIVLRIQNPLVLEAMQSERQAVAHALGTQGGSGSLSMDLFQSGSGNRGTRSDDFAAAPRNTTEAGAAEDSPANPASAPVSTATLRSDHVNIVT